MLRLISVLLRKHRAKKAALNELKKFRAYETQIRNLPAYNKKEKSLLIIRLDDIGDYILFRNSLLIYKQSLKWKDYSITLLGNDIWKDLYDSKDSGFADEVIWINKHAFINDDHYKQKIWKQLRSNGYEIVICPSRTRLLLLDDACALATGAPLQIASDNVAAHHFHKQTSDNLYSSLFVPNHHFIHEFCFNQQFASWCCGNNGQLKRPVIEFQARHTKQYIVCFIGASTGSKRWPNKRWIEFIDQWKQGNEINILVAGGKAEIANAHIITSTCGVENISGQYSLPDFIDIIGNAKAIVSNDTMAAHAGVACDRLTFIIANGNNAYRFTNYNEAGINNVWTFYPKRFITEQKSNSDKKHKNTISVTADIASVKAEDVYNVFSVVMNKQLTFQPAYDN